MRTYDVVLFLHILAAVVGFGVAAVLHTSLFRLRAATELRQVRDHMPVLRRAEPLFPISAVLLLGLGAYLLHLSGGEFSWSDGWVRVAVVALVVVEAVGGAVIGRASKQLQAAVAAAPEGPVDPSLRAMLSDRALWLGSHFNTAVIASVILLMTAKPSGLASVVIVLVGAVVGVASAVPFTRPVASHVPTAVRPSSA